MNLPGDILLLATADWEHPFWTNKQHMACELADRGFRVLYVESMGLRRPTVQPSDLRRIVRRLGRAVQPLRKVRPNVWVFSPLVLPFHNRAAARWLNDRALPLALRLASAGLGFRDPMIWTYQPLIVRWLAHLRHSFLVYHCVDNLGAAPYMPREILRQTEEELLRAANVVFTTSRALHAACLGVRRTGTWYFPNVADYAHFAQASRPGPIPEDLARIPRPRLGFIGAVSPYKVDFPLIAQVARRRPDWHWVLLGQVGEGEPGAAVDQLRLPNVHLLGPRPYRQLPDYLRGFDAALIPAARNAYTASMFPLKFFEYLAAGKPVVAANVPAVQEFVPACLLVDSADDFTEAVQRTLAGFGPDLLRASQLARQYTWEWRTNQMLEVLRDCWQNSRYSRTKQCH